MPKQTLTCTVLPQGGGRHGGLRFDVHFAPSLTGDGEITTLGAQFPDFADWPAVVSRLAVSLTIDPHGTPLTVPARRVSAPDSGVWKALFTTRTQVRTPKKLESASRLRVGSYPMRHVVHFLSRQWGRHGAVGGQHPPRFDDLIASPFRQLGFEEEGRGDGESGLVRRDRMRERLRIRYLREGSIRSHLEQLDDDEAIGLAFLQVGDLHRGVLTSLAGRPDAHPSPSPSPQPSQTPTIRMAAQERDFHDAVALSASHGPLQRMLGLVVEYETDPNPVLSGALRTDRRVTLALGPISARTTRTIVPTVVCVLGDGRFEPAPRGTGTEAGLVRFAADTYSATCVDPDAGAQAAIQFAAVLTRSHYNTGTAGHPRWEPRGAATPAEFTLPGLRTGPITVARDNRGADLADRLNDVQRLHQAWHEDADPGLSAADQELYAEDLTRGLRWDVRDGPDGRWRSLMRRDGRYELHRLPGRRFPVSDEAAVVTSTTKGRDDQKNEVTGDHLVTESVLSWSGWSLAVEPLTRPVGTDNTAGDAPGDVDTTYQFGTAFTVPPGSLPRLRFGHDYQFRARTVDLGNGGPAACEDDLGGADTTMPATRYLRYDPVEGPAVLLRRPPGPAEGPLYAVVHDDRPVSSRHVVPPRTAQQMAEWHGVLDRPRSGVPDPRAWRTLSRRDAADLTGLSAQDTGADPHHRPAYYPDPEVDAPYLPDVLARAALVRGLPGRTPETVIGFDGDWPDLRSFRVGLVNVGRGESGWRTRGRVLEVGLEPGDVYRLRISSRFDPHELDLMGVWDWMRVWAAGVPGSVDLDALRRDAEEGRLWTLTPARELMLVHAVRAPLSDPVWDGLTVARDQGATPVTVTSSVKLSQKSTATVDVVGSWRAPVDDGPGRADPTVPRQFSGTAFSVRVTHPEGPAPDLAKISVTGTHQFPDHRYRRVSYTAVATSPFVECFREEQTVRLSATHPVTLPDGTEIATVRVRDAATGTAFTPAGRDETDPDMATGDFLIDPDGTTVCRTTGGRIPDGARVVVGLVRGPVTRTGAATQVDVPASARPAPPRIRYVVPSLAWDSSGPSTSRRLGGGLRVYLERPWWSSGDGELLGVVLLSDSTAMPPDDLRPYLTNWGTDPATTSARLEHGPTLSSFPMATATAPATTLPELGSVRVDVAGHPVAYDPARDLWYADVRITDHDDVELDAYLPFVRLALVRLQPRSLPGCALSTVVTADFVQLLGGRTVSVTTDGPDYVITLSGPGLGPSSRTRAFVEKRGRLLDPELGWDTAGPVVELTAGGQAATRTGRLPCPGGDHRIVVQEYEHLSTGSGSLDRVVHTDIIDRW